MKHHKSHQIWLHKLALILFAALVVFYKLIPFTFTPSAYPSPDIMFCIICVLIIRRPEIVPFWMITLIYFGFDIFLMKPFGVWTACILIATEIMRANRDAFRENLFLYEWFYASLILFLAHVGNQLLLTISLVPTPSTLALFWEFAFTVLSYPVILFIITYILRIKKSALGAFGFKGHRL
jgi:rod shape-determining protein MreD